MSNLNIQQKACLAAQKVQENKVKEAALSETQQRLNEYNDIVKPNLTEEQAALIDKYLQKLAVLGYKVL